MLISAAGSVVVKTNVSHAKDYGSIPHMVKCLKPNFGVPCHDMAGVLPRSSKRNVLTEVTALKK